MELFAKYLKHKCIIISKINNKIEKKRKIYGTMFLHVYIYLCFIYYIEAAAVQVIIVYSSPLKL